MSWASEIHNFLEDYADLSEFHNQIDIYGKLKVTGDDFHEMVEKYSKEFQVDMSSYRWYFHADEEGSMSIGEIFVTPPYKKVDRIPITPEILAKFAHTKKWDIDYPKHKPPGKRWDLIINALILIGLVIFIAWYYLK